MAGRQAALHGYRRYLTIATRDEMELKIDVPYIMPLENDLHKKNLLSGIMLVTSGVL